METNLTRAALKAKLRTRLGLPPATPSSSAVQLTRDQCVAGVRLRVRASIVQSSNISIVNEVISRLGLQPPTAVTLNTAQQIAAIRARLGTITALSTFPLVLTKAQCRTEVLTRTNNQAGTTTLATADVDSYLIANNRDVRLRSFWVTTSNDLSADGTNTDSDAEVVIELTVGDVLSLQGDQQGASAARARAESRLSLLRTYRDETLTELIAEAGRIQYADSEAVVLMAAARAASVMGQSESSSALASFGKSRLDQLRATNPAEIMAWWRQGSLHPNAEGDEEAGILGACEQASNVLGNVNAAGTFAKQYAERIRGITQSAGTYLVELVSSANRQLALVHPYGVTGDGTLANGTDIACDGEAVILLACADHRRQAGDGNGESSFRAQAQARLQVLRESNDGKINELFNEAAVEAWRRWPWIRTTTEAVLTVTAGVATVALPSGVISDQVLEVAWSDGDGNTDDRWVPLKSTTFQNTWSVPPTGDATDYQDQPQFYQIRQAIELWPIPISSGSLRIRTRIDVPFVDDTTVIPVDAELLLRLGKFIYYRDSRDPVQMKMAPDAMAMAIDHGNDLTRRQATLTNFATGGVAYERSMRRRWR